MDQQQTPTIMTNPNNKAAVTINDLPNELLLSIFNRLAIQDLIRCRLVCRRFMHFCDEVKVPELIVSNKIEDFKEYWFHTNKQLNYKDGIDLRTFKRHRLSFKMNECVKRLYFRGTYSDFQQIQLNDLTHLEQLKIDVKPDLDSHKNFGKMENISIELPNLKILEIGDDHSDHVNIYLTTPELKMLKCNEFMAIYVIHPDSIIHLETNFYNHTPQLKNIQYLKVDWTNIPNAEILSFHPKLTTLACKQSEHDEDEEYYASIEGLLDLVEQKRILGRNDLKIYYQSVELLDSNKIDEFESTTPWSTQILAFQINNYDSLCDNISFNNPLDYNKLMSCVKGELPSDFHKKYFNIPSVKVANNVKSKEHLVRFLKSLQYLDKLHFENSSLDQSFYDGLPEIGQLTELYWEKSSTRIANYNFLFKFKCLEKFHTDRDSKRFFDLALGLFGELKYFYRVGFYFDREFYLISKYETSNDYVYDFGRYTKHDIKRKTIFEKRGMAFYQMITLVNSYKIGKKLTANNFV